MTNIFFYVIIIVLKDKESFDMKNLQELIKELNGRELKISKTTKGEMIHQTQRNGIKAELMSALLQDIKAVNEYTFRTADGIVFEIENESIKNGISNELGSGAITVCVDLKIMSLETDASVDSEDYENLLQEKQEKAEKKKKDKAEKIAYDTKRRKGE